MPGSNLGGECIVPLRNQYFKALIQTMNEPNYLNVKCSLVCELTHATKTSELGVASM